MIVIFVVVLVVFGPNKLPELARGLGKLMADFRKASTDFKTAFEEEMRDIERQAREVERKKAADAATASAAAYSESQPAALAFPSASDAPEEDTKILPPTIRASEESVPRDSQAEHATETEHSDSAAQEGVSAIVPSATHGQHDQPA